MEVYKIKMKKLLVFLPFIILSFILGCSSGKDLPREDNLVKKAYQVMNMGNINSPANDYSFRVTPNGKWAMFTSSRKHPRNDIGDDDIWYCNKSESGWMDPIVMEAPLNFSTPDDFGGDGSPTFTSDGKEMFFASAREGGFGDVDLYSAKYVNGVCTDIKNLGSIVNGGSFDSHPFLSSDGSTLYFTSDRADGIGGMDIWMTTREAGGSWKKPVNLGSNVNTGSDESSAFITSDNNSLFFSSKGHPGYGGYDIYVSQRSGSGWGTPKNLGAPINSEWDDRFPFIPKSGEPVYFSSNRGGGSGGYDLYAAPEPPKTPNSIAGIVTSSLDKKPLSAKLVFKDIETGKVLSTLDSKSEKGDYSLSIPKGRKIEIAATAEQHNPLTVNAEFTQETGQDLKSDIVLQRMKSNLKMTVSHSMATSNLSSKDAEISKFTGLILREIKVVESIPVLNYLFFDKEQSALPNRYKLFQSSKDTAGFNESTMFGAQLIQYYNVLNVIGSRMKKFKNANIVVEGCNDNEGGELNNTQLSKNRAETIKDYLVNIWGIKADRIKLLSRNLPNVPSPLNTEEGMSENRRVEIQCDNWEIIKPVTSYGQTENELSPSKVSFNVKVSSDIDEPDWSVVIKQKDSPMKIIPGKKSGTFVKDWNWKNEDNELVAIEEPILYYGIAKSSIGEEMRTETKTIMVKKISITGKTYGAIKEKVVDKISLILFDFRKYDLSPQNVKVLDLIYEKIRSNSIVNIFGHTDIIGTDEANLDLSKKRANKVHDSLKKVKPKNQYLYDGVGKNDPLYSNTLPEGRFYNRTVQILVETELN